MTLRELCQECNVDLCLFDASDWHSKGFYNPDTNVLAIDYHLSEDDQVKIAMHELAHKEHLPHLYQIHREKYELQANRKMIRYLVAEALSKLDDIHDFNYIDFMRSYNLKTTTDEVITKEELKK